MTIRKAFNVDRASAQCGKSPLNHAETEAFGIRPMNCLKIHEFLKFSSRKGQATAMKQMAYQTEERQLRAKMEEVLSRHRDQGPLKIENAADPFDQIQASVERDLLV